MARWLIALFAMQLCSGATAAAALDAKRIGDLTGLPTEAADGVVKVSKPRGDIRETVDGRALKPFQGLTSWAAFQPSGSGAIVMGDIVLLENEANPALSAALEGGLEVTALHNHFFYDSPRVYFMHIGGSGDEEKLARAVRAVLDAAEQAPKGDGFGGPAVAGEDAIDAAPLEAILGGHAQAKDGMAKFVFGRTAAMHGTTMGAPMGVNTWAAFAGRNDAAVVDGDFAMLESEVQDVLKALRSAGIDIVAIHSHMAHEEPRIVFLHFWGKGPAEDLARGIRKARDTQEAGKRAGAPSPRG
ncbi:MAG TPA: DUF1259 domain-containing protein [Candidatus Binatia bacterium]|nr:DUF1259 domain-containing protein [Candidatus Binatia bacterium]